MSEANQMNAPFALKDHVKRFVTSKKKKLILVIVKNTKVYISSNLGKRQYT
jgi:hypothetical protein